MDFLELRGRPFLSYLFLILGGEVILQNVAKRKGIPRPKCPGSPFMDQTWPTWSKNLESLRAMGVS